MFSLVNLNPVIADDSNTAGLAWEFDSGLATFDFLANGESLVLTYTVQVTDSQGATDDNTVVITIGGTNDAPTITGEVVSKNDGLDQTAHPHRFRHLRRRGPRYLQRR